MSHVRRYAELGTVVRVGHPAHSRRRGTGYPAAAVDGAGQRGRDITVRGCAPHALAFGAGEAVQFGPEDRVRIVTGDAWADERGRVLLGVHPAVDMPPEPGTLLVLADRARFRCQVSLIEQPASLDGFHPELRVTFTEIGADEPQ